MTEVILKLESLLRSGQVPKVREILLKINLSQVERPEIAVFAGLARRAGLVRVALRILHPIIRPKNALRQPASVAETALYAATLARIGAYEEAESLFKSIRHQANDEALLFEAFTHIYQWQYQQATRCLKAYLNFPGLSEYDIAIAKVNLAACYQFLGVHAKQKVKLLEEVLDFSERNNWVRMHRNALELSAQSVIGQNELMLADDLLLKLDPGGGNEDLFVEKWRAVLTLKRTGDTEPLLGLREKSQVQNRGEVVRECDFYLAMQGRDAALATKVYFGTSFPAYRKHLLEEMRPWLRLPKDYVWRTGQSSKVFDLGSGLESGGSARLKVNQSQLRLLRFLASDFYRSFPLGSLFSHLYRGEIFDIQTSPGRVRRTVERLRIWFKSNDIPLNLRSQNGQFDLQFRGDYALRVGRRPTLENQQALSSEYLRQLRSCFGGRGFASKEAASTLGISIEETRKLFKRSIARKRVRVAGRSRATRFYLSK